MIEYYNLNNHTVININSECCSFEDWINNKGKGCKCCKHQNGFYIFLEPNELKLSDEYSISDPYTVIENFNSQFHQRRLDCTLELIDDYVINLNSNRKVLDLGCGQGHITNKIKEVYPTFELYGLDYSISAIDFANTKYKGIDFIVANAFYPPYEDEFFDIIICNNLWEHVPDPLSLLKSISRILKTNGLIIISTPSRYRLTNLLRTVMGKPIKFISNLHITEYSIGQVKEQLKSGGFEIQHVFSPSIREKRISFRILKVILKLYLRIIRSHHILEATAFYSAKKLSKNNDPIK